MSRMALLVWLGSGLLCFLPAFAQAGDEAKTVGKGGLKIEGSVEEGDPKVKISDGDKAAELPAKMFSIKLSAGKTYKFDLTTDKGNHDPFLVIQDAAGKQLAYDDDGGGKLNSRLMFKAPKDQTYKIYAAGLFTAGPFVLSIQEVAAAKAIDLKIGGKVDGKLDAATKEVIYEVKLTEGKKYVIDMTSAEENKLDPYIKLLDSNGKIIAMDDDGGEGLNSKLKFQATETGVYRVVATSFIGVGSGPFILQLREEE